MFAMLIKPLPSTPIMKVLCWSGTTLSSRHFLGILYGLWLFFTLMTLRKKKDNGVLFLQQHLKPIAWLKVNQDVLKIQSYHHLHYENSAELNWKQADINQNACVRAHLFLNTYVTDPTTNWCKGQCLHKHVYYTTRALKALKITWMCAFKALHFSKTLPSERVFWLNEGEFHACLHTSAFCFSCAINGRSSF